MSVCNYFTRKLMFALVRTRTQRSGTRTPTRLTTVMHRVRVRVRRVPGVALSTSTKLRDANLFGRFDQPDKTSDRQKLIVGSRRWRADGVTGIRSGCIVQGFSHLPRMCTLHANFCVSYSYSSSSPPWVDNCDTHCCFLNVSCLRQLRAQLQCLHRALAIHCITSLPASARN